MRGAGSKRGNKEDEKFEEEEFGSLCSCYFPSFLTYSYFRERRRTKMVTRKTPPFSSSSFFFSSYSSSPPTLRFPPIPFSFYSSSSFSTLSHYYSFIHQTPLLHLFILFFLLLLSPSTLRPLYALYWSLQLIIFLLPYLSSSPFVILISFFSSLLLHFLSSYSSSYTFFSFSSFSSFFVPSSSSDL